MSSAASAQPLVESPWTLPSRGRIGMISLIVAESAIFLIFVVAYIYYIGKSVAGPMPRDVLETPVFITICLLSSSITIHLAAKALHNANLRAFGWWWFTTMTLGAIFLIGTGLEWRHLIVEKDLTISTNLFGTTYYSLVGLHASHVTVGLIGIAIVMTSVFMGKLRPEHAGKVDVFSMYWHFVDAVWVVVFTVVYIIGR